MANKVKMTFTIDKDLADQVRKIVKQLPDVSFSGLMADILPQVVQQAKDEGLDVTVDREE